MRPKSDLNWYYTVYLHTALDGFDILFRSIIVTESQNHRKAWIRRDLIDNLIPAPVPPSSLFLNTRD